MFEKIRHEEDFRLIKPGTILIKYPTLGNPTEEIDLSDEHFFMVYEAKKVNKTRIELELHDETGPASKIGKSFHGILNESIWWIRKEEDSSQKN
jgi:hypothetical protein